MICDILGVLSPGPTAPTHILYKANVSWKVLSSYLDYLLKKGMVEREENGGKRMAYKLTLKGRTVLRLYEELRAGLTGGKASIETTAWPSQVEVRQPTSNW